MTYNGGADDEDIRLGGGDDDYVKLEDGGGGEDDYVKLEDGDGGGGGGGGAHWKAETSSSRSGRRGGGGGGGGGWWWAWAKPVLVVLFVAVLGAVFFKWVGPFCMDKEIIPWIIWERETFSTTWRTS